MNVPKQINKAAQKSFLLRIKMKLNNMSAAIRGLICTLAADVINSWAHKSKIIKACFCLTGNDCMATSNIHALNITHNKTPAASGNNAKGAMIKENIGP